MIAMDRHNWTMPDKDWLQVAEYLRPRDDRAWQCRAMLQSGIKRALGLEELKVAPRLADDLDELKRARKAMADYCFAIYGTRDPMRAQTMRPRLASIPGYFPAEVLDLDEGGELVSDEALKLLRLEFTAISDALDRLVSDDRPTIKGDIARKEVILSALRAWRLVHAEIPWPAHEGKLANFDHYLDSVCTTYIGLSGGDPWPWDTVRSVVERHRDAVMTA